MGNKWKWITTKRGKRIHVSKKSEWISVKDKLPEQYEEVLVYSAKYGVQVDWIADKVTNKYLWWNYGELVTHWMPMPEQPKGVNFNE